MEDGDTRPPYLPPEKTVFRSRRNRTGRGPMDLFQIEECVNHSVMSDSLWPHGLAYWGAHKAHPSMEFSRQEYWSGLPLPSPGESSWPRDRTGISCFAGRQLYSLSHQGSRKMGLSGITSISCLCQFRACINFMIRIKQTVSYFQMQFNGMGDIIIC